MALDLTSFDAALKQHYTDHMIHDMVYKDNPLLAMLTKYENFGGRNLPVPLIYGNPQGRSANFLKAQTRGAATSSKLEDFVLTRVKDYSIATIDNETLEASEGDANAFMTAATTEIDGAINSLTRSLATAAYGDGSGVIGQRASISTNTITLTRLDDVTNFEVGMNLVATTDKTVSGLRTGTSLVVGIDRALGTVEINDAADITSFADADYLAVDGDVEAKIKGLEAWIPATAPTSTSFFGVNRTQDSTRLGGMRHDGSAQPIEEALIDAASAVAREGGRTDKIFISYEKFAELEKALGAQVTRVNLEVTQSIGFRGIQIHGPKGPIDVIADQNCPSDRAYGLQMNTWKLYSLKKAVRVIDTDGLSMLRQASADGVEVRYGFKGQMGCSAPGFNVNIQL